MKDRGYIYSLSKWWQYKNGWRCNVCVVPKPLWSKQYNANERNQINLPTHPILIQTAQYNLIIDAGIGNGKLSKSNYVILE